MHGDGMMEPVGVRGPLRHVYDILMNARKPIKKTNLMYKTRLNFIHLSKYLPSLVEKGLIEEVPYLQPRTRRPDRRTPYLYVVTEEGEALLRLYRRIYAILG